MYTFSKRSRAILDTVHPTLQHIFEEAIVDSPFDFGITSGYRTAEEQNELYNRGASQRDGYIKKSYHQTGCAIDIAVYTEDGLTWEEDYYKIVAGHIIGTAKRLGYEIEWGGLWPSFKDYVHIQIEE